MRRLLCFTSMLTALLVGSASAQIITARYDFLPKTCPNYFTPPHHTASVDSLPTAVLGTPDVDVTTIRANSLVLIVPGGGGRGYTTLYPLATFIKDVARPVDDTENCKCTGEGGDGTLDLLALFDPFAIGAALGVVHDGDRIPVCIQGELDDTTPFEGCDCIIIKLGAVGIDPGTFGRVKSTYR